MAADVTAIGVVGSGQKESGIAQVAAMHGIDVWLLDIDPQALSGATNSISASINCLVSKGYPLSKFEDIKKTLFLQLDKIGKSSAILASNTSSISITRVVSSTSIPHQVRGMHFLNAPPVMKLIEIVRGADTSDKTFASTKALSERLGKTVITSQDYSVFIYVDTGRLGRRRGIGVYDYRKEPSSVKSSSRL